VNVVKTKKTEIRPIENVVIHYTQELPCTAKKTRASRIVLKLAIVARARSNVRCDGIAQDRKVCNDFPISQTV
jgi:hypothetical protein